MVAVNPDYPGPKQAGPDGERYRLKNPVFYDDALAVIPELKGKYKLAIVSDAWPSLLDVYEENNMTSYFDSIILSSFIGASKPDRKM